MERHEGRAAVTSASTILALKEYTSDPKDGLIGVNKIAHGITFILRLVSSVDSLKRTHRSRVNIDVSWAGEKERHRERERERLQLRKMTSLFTEESRGKFETLFTILTLIETQCLVITIVANVRSHQGW